MTDNGDPAPNNKETALIAIYQEVCKSYHAIDTFRAKLLGLLPLASGTGIFLLLGNGFFTQRAVVLLPIGLFGVGATFGLFALELRGIQKCRALIRAGEDIEKNPLMNLKYHFARRAKPPSFSPPRLLRILLPPESDTDSAESRIGPSEEVVGIDAAMAARVMYSSVLAAWVFVALVGLINIIVLILDGSDAPFFEGGRILVGMFTVTVIISLFSFRAFYRRSGEYIREADEELRRAKPTDQ
jgi:hypothetical protein